MSEHAALYRKLVDASTDGLWLLDERGRTLVFNPRMAELLGRTPEQMEGLSAFEVHDAQGKHEFAIVCRDRRQAEEIAKLLNSKDRPKEIEVHG